MKLIAILLVPFILSTPALCQVRMKLANVGTLAFDCGRMPEVCKNMCFGVHCRGGKYGKTFTYDPNGNIVARQNNSQGGTLAAFINAKTQFIKNTPPFLYDIAFTNAGKFVGKALAPKGGKWVTPFRRREMDLVPSTFHQYMSKSGELVTSARRMEAGQKLYHAKIDPVKEAATLENPDENARNAFLANPDNYEVVEDEVVRPVTREEAATLA
ncbi:hypothetical protein UCDDA912_g10549 [Diaporthe ampelina]|uniref:Uncharacterized protein n=1 Tax=Diaporthe ampelina TaxID=1214573 RepID=A0A0G2F438_9PEZI|nr:hypothetical protein UCDDA912_g10549 [Diaporthe ampelina]